MEKAVLGARVLLGLIFTIFSINYFVPFLPQPAMPEAAGNFMGALAATGYMLPLIKITELVAGLMLLAGFFVPLALILLAPVVLNIVLFHLFLAPGGTILGLVALVLGLFLAWAYRDSYASVLQAKSTPSV